MRKWEHQAVELRYDRLLASINEAGAEGWQLVQVGQPYQHIPADENMTQYHVVWLKRELE